MTRDQPTTQNAAEAAARARADAAPVAAQGAFHVELDDLHATCLKLEEVRGRTAKAKTTVTASQHETARKPAGGRLVGAQSAWGHVQGAFERAAAHAAALSAEMGSVQGAAAASARAYEHSDNHGAYVVWSARGHH